MGQFSFLIYLIGLGFKNSTVKSVSGGSVLGFGRDILAGQFETRIGFLLVLRSIVSNVNADNGPGACGQGSLGCPGLMAQEEPSAPCGGE